MSIISVFLFDRGAYRNQDNLDERSGLKSAGSLISNPKVESSLGFCKCHFFTPAALAFGIQCRDVGGRVVSTIPCKLH